MSNECEVLLADELLIRPRESEHKLCSRAQREDIESVHKLRKVQTQSLSGPGAIVMREELQQQALVIVCFSSRRMGFPLRPTEGHKQ